MAATSTESQIVDETVAENDTTKSALQDNIENKGNNAYYFAHATKRNGPKWDGKQQPRLLSPTNDADLVASASELTVSIEETQTLLKSLKRAKSSFDFSKSNITKYAFLDEGKKVKIYVELPGVGDVCVNDEDVTLQCEDRSFSLLVKNYSKSDAEEEEDTMATDVNDEAEEKKTDADPLCLCFGRLHGSITKASFKKKTDRIIITLVKKLEEGEEEAKEWPAVGAKGGDEDDF
jgi:HSP20 family molecular chaperone IbpA